MGCNGTFALRAAFENSQGFLLRPTEDKTFKIPLPYLLLSREIAGIPNLELLADGTPSAPVRFNSNTAIYEGVYPVLTYYRGTSIHNNLRDPNWRAVMKATENMELGDSRESILSKSFEWVITTPAPGIPVAGSLTKFP